MDTFTLVLVIPTLLTMGSATVLFFSFKEQIDISGRYFLSAELLWLLTLLLLITINLYPTLINPAVLFVNNFSAVLSEAAILFSLKALTKDTRFRQFIYTGLLVAIYCAIVEYCRIYIDPKLPLLFISMLSIFFTISTFIVCRNIKSNGLESNLFIRWIAYLELGLTAIHALRLSSYFSDAPILPRNPSTTHILVFSLFLSLNLFRYISYQSLRISWVDLRVSSDNVLNRNLARLVKEKNQFLQGLISSNRALGISALANSLAHQLSQPITGVILQTETVKRDLSEQGNQQKSVETLNTVSDQLKKLFELVNNLRRLFSNKESTFIPFKLQDACEEMLEVITPTLQSKKIGLQTRYESNPIVFGNPIHIQQVLINLFNNAIDAIEDSNNTLREITLTLSLGQNEAVLSITDSGKGISTAVLSSAFELYQTTKPDGLGIGLWLCKTIIDNHLGTIIASNGSAGGAVFEIRIPLASQAIETNT